MMFSNKVRLLSSCLIVMVGGLLLNSVCWSATKSANQLADEGKSALDGENYKEAIRSLHGAYLMRPRNTDVLYDLGLAYYALGIKERSPEFIQSSSYYWQQAIPLLSDGSLLKTTLSDLVTRNKDMHESLRRYIEVKDQFDSLPSVDSGLTYVKALLEISALEDAHELFEQLATTYREDPRPYSHWADFVISQGRIGWGLSFYRRALEIDSNYEPARDRYYSLLSSMERIRIEGYDKVARASH